MQKVLVTLIITLLLSFQSIAQKSSDKVSVKWGDELKVSKKSTLSGVIGYDETGFYARKWLGGGKIAIEHFDNNQRLTKSSEVKVSEGKKGKSLAFMTHFNDEIYLFTSEIDKDRGKKFLYIQDFSKKTLTTSSSHKKIAELPLSTSKRKRSGSFSIHTSRDSSKFMIYYELPYEKEGKEKFGFQVYDEKMDELWSDNIVLPYEDALFSVNTIRVHDDGSVYILGKKYKERRTFDRKEETSFDYHMLAYTDKGKTLNEIEIPNGDKFLAEMQFVIKDNEDIVCVGYYSNNFNTSTKDGTYFLKIDGKSGKVTKKSFKEFPLDFITQNLTIRQENKTKKKVEKGKDVHLYEYRIDDLIMKDDGGVIMIGEQYYVRVVTTTTTDSEGRTTTRTTYYYHYNDILVMNISPDGDILWNEKVPKRMVTANDGGFYSSYVYAYRGDKLHFIFNDNMKNLYYKGEGKVYKTVLRKESLVAMVTMNLESGKQERESLFSTNDVEIIVRPKVCRQIAEDVVVLFGEKKKIHQFAKVQFK